MFIAGQIVYGLDTKQPVEIADPWDIKPEGHRLMRCREFRLASDPKQIALPKSKEEALEMLTNGEILVGFYKGKTWENMGPEADESIRAPHVDSIPIKPEDMSGDPANFSKMESRCEHS